MDYKQAQAFMEIQKQLNKLQEELSNIHIEAEDNGLVIVFDANSKIQKIYFENNTITSDEETKNKIIQSITSIYEKSSTKIKEISTEKMQKLLENSPLNVPKREFPKNTKKQNSYKYL